VDITSIAEMDGLEAACRTVLRARSGTSVFKTQYLSSVPFDLAATRDFLIGNVPPLATPFWNSRVCGIGQSISARERSCTGTCVAPQRVSRSHVEESELRARRDYSLGHDHRSLHDLVLRLSSSRNQPHLRSHIGRHLRANRSHIRHGGSATFFGGSSVVVHRYSVAHNPAGQACGVNRSFIIRRGRERWRDQSSPYLARTLCENPKNMFCSEELTSETHEQTGTCPHHTSRSNQKLETRNSLRQDSIQYRRQRFPEEMQKARPRRLPCSR